MKTDALGRVLAVGLALVLPCVAATASAQSPEDGSPAPRVVSDATLARIRQALDSEPGLTIDQDALRFYMQISAKPPTFADYLKASGAWFEISQTSAPTRLGGGARAPAVGGIDLLSLFGRAGKAIQDRKARQIREQIDRELRALAAAKASTPAP